MSAIGYPLAGCQYSTDDTEPVLVAAQLKIHSLSLTTAKQRPSKIKKEVLSVPYLDDKSPNDTIDYSYHPEQRNGNSSHISARTTPSQCYQRRYAKGL